MKRSEMIQRIKDAIPSIDMDTQAQQEIDLNEGAEHILDVIEKAGMLPPNVCWLATGEYGPAKELLSLAEEDYDARLSWEEE